MTEFVFKTKHVLVFNKTKFNKTASIFKFGLKDVK